jgi:ribonucleotide reductase alpha subunit
MPTASTSQILGNTESFEPLTSNLYLRRTLAGEFIVVNKHMVNDLIHLNLWSPDIRQKIIAANGSIQNIDNIPLRIKEIYKTVWEMSGKTILEMAASRGPFIDQSQSLNAHLPNLTPAKLSSYHFYAYRKGLKTGMYYLRTRAAVDPIKFTVDPKIIKQIENSETGNKIKEKTYKNEDFGNIYDPQRAAEILKKEQKENFQKKVKKQKIIHRSPYKQKNTQQAKACRLRRKNGPLGEEEPCFSCGS